MKDQRSGKIFVVSHCILDVHCLEDDCLFLLGIVNTLKICLFQCNTNSVEVFGVRLKTSINTVYDVSHKHILSP